MVDKNDTLWREIEEEVRREQFAKLWNKYGTYLIVAVLLLLIGVGGVQYYRHASVQSAETAGAKFDLARDLLANNKTEEATQAFTEITSLGAVGYQTLADLKLAGLHFKAGKTAEALAAYEAVANNIKADALFRGFARLQAASLRIGEADFTEMQNRLTDLTGEASPWRGQARELLGVAAFKAGQDAEARKLMEQVLADQASSVAARQRAEMVMGAIVERDLAKASPASDAKTPASAEAKPTEEKK